MMIIRFDRKDGDRDALDSGNNFPDPFRSYRRSLLPSLTQTFPVTGAMALGQQYTPVVADLPRMVAQRLLWSVARPINVDSQYPIITLDLDQIMPSGHNPYGQKKHPQVELSKGGVPVFSGFRMYSFGDDIKFQHWPNYASDQFGWISDQDHSRCGRLLPITYYEYGQHKNRYPFILPQTTIGLLQEFCDRYFGATDWDRPANLHNTFATGYDLTQIYNTLNRPGNWFIGVLAHPQQIYGNLYWHNYKEGDANWPPDDNFYQTQEPFLSNWKADQAKLVKAYSMRDTLSQYAYKGRPFDLKIYNCPNYPFSYKFIYNDHGQNDRLKTWTRYDNCWPKLGSPDLPPPVDVTNCDVAAPYDQIVSDIGDWEYSEIHLMVCGVPTFPVNPSLFERLTAEYFYWEQYLYYGYIPEVNNGDDGSDGFQYYREDPPESTSGINDVAFFDYTALFDMYKDLKIKYPRTAVYIHFNPYNARETGRGGGGISGIDHWPQVVCQLMQNSMLGWEEFVDSDTDKTHDKPFTQSIVMNDRVEAEVKK